MNGESEIAKLRSDAADLLANEELVLKALKDAYQKGHIPYAVFSEGYDATVARGAALSFLADPILIDQPKDEACAK